MLHRLGSPRNGMNLSIGPFTANRLKKWNGIVLLEVYNKDDE
jgi:hypothetical protein